MYENISFNPACPDNIDTLLDLIKEFYLQEQIEFDGSRSRKALDKIFSNSLFGNIWLILIEEKVIGYFALTYAFSLEFGGRNALLDEIYIREKFRRKGIGTRAINFIFEQCKLNDIHAVHLQVLNFNDDAKRLYERNGFELVDRMFMTKVFD